MAYFALKLYQEECPNNQESKNSHCVYKSIGDLVTGEPVNILLYLASFPSFNTDFVLLASLFLIVVDSSIAIKAE